MPAFTRAALATASSLALAGLLAGCATGAAETAPSADDTAVATAMPSATAEATASAVPAIAIPDGPDDPIALAAWDALMGPDGEYAASASYQAVIDAFGPVEPYVTIQAAEERHVDALIRRLEACGVEAPENPYLGQLPAPADLATAAQSWADGEVANIAMYDELMARAAGDGQLEKVFTNLRSASQDSHLPMFQAAAENGGTLTAEQMAQFTGSGSGGGGNGGGQGGNG